MNLHQDPDSLASAKKDQEIADIFYFIFFGVLFLIAFVIFINCLISLYQHKMAEREAELLRLERLRASGPGKDLSCAPGNYVPGLSFQPRIPTKCMPPRRLLGGFSSSSGDYRGRQYDI